MHQKIDHRSPLSNKDLKELLDELESAPEGRLNNLTSKVIIEECLYLRQLNAGEIPESENARNVRALLLIVADYQDSISALKRALRETVQERDAAQDFIKSARFNAAFGISEEPCEG